MQNLLLVVSSYVFYGWWDWRFLFLILFSSLVDYFVGIAIFRSSTQIKRKLLLFLSIGVNLGFLGFFKYFNFFVDNFVAAFTFFGAEIQANTLNIILPVGISFYTFQSLSYSIDVYRKKLQPTRDIIAFLAYVSFFPQLVAGPIERATRLLPQFFNKRHFDYSKAVDGLRQILWGLFKKIVIADNCAVHVNEIFGNSGDLSGSTLVLGGLLFTIQVYGDFSGYSDIAIGTSRLFGFNLMKNFAFPFFSRDMAEFWRRWHISLSTWFRDYLYIPLGGSHGSLSNRIRNVFIIFIVAGFWHGADWTYVFWGVLNALYFLPLLLANKNREYIEIVAKGRITPNLRETYQMVTTFALLVISLILFRSENMNHAFDIFSVVFSKSLFFLPDMFPRKLFVIVGVFFLIEWIGREDNYAIERLGARWKRPFRYAMYYAMILMIYWFGGEEQEFIYFQF